MMPTTVFPGNDDLKAFENDAYEGAEDSAREYRVYQDIGPAVYERPYRAGVLREWPRHTDFRPDNIAVRD